MVYTVYETSEHNIHMYIASSACYMRSGTATRLEVCGETGICKSVYIVVSLNRLAIKQSGLSGLID